MRAEFPARQSSPSSRRLWIRDCRMHARILPFQETMRSGQDPFPRDGNR